MRVTTRHTNLPTCLYSGWYGLWPPKPSLTNNISHNPYSHLLVHHCVLQRLGCVCLKVSFTRLDFSIGGPDECILECTYWCWYMTEPYCTFVYSIISVKCWQIQTMQRFSILLVNLRVVQVWWLVVTIWIIHNCLTGLIFERGQLHLGSMEITPLSNQLQNKQNHKVKSSQLRHGPEARNVPGITCDWWTQHVASSDHGSLEVLPLPKKNQKHLQPRMDYCHLSTVTFHWTPWRASSASAVLGFSWQSHALSW